MALNRRKPERSSAPADTSGGGFFRALMRLAMLGALGTVAVFAGQLALRWATTTPAFSIQTISISGNQRAASDELVRLSGLAPGGNLFTADLDAAERALSQEPWVKSVEVHRRLPHTVQVRITEREPALTVDLGKLYFADRDGSVFKRALGGDDLDLPVVTGLSRARFQEQRGDIEAELRELIAFTGSFHDRHLDARVRLEELNADEDDGLTLTLAPVDRKGELQTVKLGAAPYDDKLERLGQLWNELDRRGVRAQVIRLDNRNRPGWVAVKLASSN